MCSTHVPLSRASPPPGLPQHPRPPSTHLLTHPPTHPPTRLVQSMEMDQFMELKRDHAQGEHAAQAVRALLAGGH